CRLIFGLPSATNFCEVIPMRAALFLIAFCPGLCGLTGEKQAPEKPPLPRLLKDMHSKDGDVRLQAVIALADFGPAAKAAVPELVEALRAKDEDLRLNAAVTLGKIGAAAVAPVSKLLDGKDHDTRYCALLALAWVGPDAAASAPVVGRMLADKSAE